jgi:hypothetical protein
VSLFQVVSTLQTLKSQGRLQVPRKFAVPNLPEPTEDDCTVRVDLKTQDDDRAERRADLTDCMQTTRVRRVLESERACVMASED